MTRQLQLAALSEAAETYLLRVKASNTIYNDRSSFLYRSEYSHDEGIAIGLKSKAERRRASAFDRLNKP